MVSSMSLSFASTSCLNEVHAFRVDVSEQLMVGAFGFVGRSGLLLCGLGPAAKANQHYRKHGSSHQLWLLFWKPMIISYAVFFLKKKPFTLNPAILLPP